MQKVIVGLSGGVDSAVSALLLKQQGYQVNGLYMKNWEEDDAQGCSSEEDLKFARQVADQLDIQLHTANFSDQYWTEVFENFLSEYRSGRTPNPDVLCNREIKFKTFIEHAQTLGCDKIAMGHYAESVMDDNGWHLLKGIDDNKDQSYFLHLISQQNLSETIFPLAEMTKPQVREIARKHQFQCHSRKDSTGICFINTQRFSDFLARYLPPEQGDILDENGTVIGQHKGCWYYTLGQRQGIGVGGISAKQELPWYVADKDIKENTITIVQGNDHPLLFHSRLIATDLYWINRIPDSKTRLTCKIRYRQADQECRIDFMDNDQLQVVFDCQQRSITPGQSVVFYSDKECLGGGIITSR